MTAFTKVTVSTSGAKTVRSTVACSVSAFKDIMGATVAEIAFAGRTFAMLTDSAFSMAAGHHFVIALAEIITAGKASIVITAFTVEMSTTKRIMGADAKIAVTGGAVLMVTKLAGGMSAGKGFMAALANRILASRAIIVFTRFAGIVTASQEIVVTYGTVVTAMETKLKAGKVIMVIAVAEGIITIGANIMFAYGKVTAAMRAKLYCGSRFFNVGGQDIDVFGGTACNVEQVAFNDIINVAFNGIIKRNDSAHSTFKPCNRDVPIATANDNGSGKAYVCALGKGSQLTFKKEFVRFHRSGMLNGALAEALNGLHRFQFHNIGVSHFGTNHSGLVAYSKFVLYFSIDVKVVAVFIGQQKGGRRYSCNSPRHTVVLI